jgi:hypothetical protein
MTKQIQYFQISFSFREVQRCVLGLRGVILNNYYKFRNKTLSLCQTPFICLYFLLFPSLSNKSNHNFGNRFRFLTLAAETLYFNYYSTLDKIQTKTHCFGIQHSIFKPPYKLSGLFHLFSCNSGNVAEIQTRSLSITTM